MHHHPNWKPRWISVHVISVLGMFLCIFILEKLIDIHVALNLQIILQGHPIENIVNVFLLSQTDRQTDILLTEKVITDLFVIEMKEIYVHVYTRLLIC